MLIKYELHETLNFVKFVYDTNIQTKIIAFFMASESSLKVSYSCTLC